MAGEENIWLTLLKFCYVVRDTRLPLKTIRFKEPVAFVHPFNG
jgi:hypothetical protein